MLPAWTIDLLLTAGDAAPQAPAEGPAQQPDPLRGFANLLIPMVLIFAIFWLLVIRPESRKRKEREFRLANLKKGDTVVTTGGMIGKVWRVEGNEVVLIIDKDKDLKAHFTKSAMFDLVKSEASKEAGESPSKDVKEGTAS